MNQAISNIWRRPLRTALTILGIVIGVFALTVMGALAENLNVLVDGGDEYFRTRVFVFDEGAASGFQASARPITRDLVDGIEPETWYDPSVELRVDAGRLLEGDERGVAVIGADLAERYDKRVGDTMEIRGHSFEVVGVLERTLTFPDKIAYVALRDAQEIYVENVPQALDYRTDELATQIEVFPDDLSQADAVASAIEDTVDGVRTVTPEQVADQIGQASVVFNLIIVGASVIAVIVGGLSVINTMVMTVSERVREIGIKKAVGARTRSILAEFIAEATLLGAIGGVIGLSAGWLLVVVLNAQTSGSGTTVFLVTPMLLLRSFAFATLLGALAGIYPAFRAARLDPVQA